MKTMLVFAVVLFSAINMFPQKGIVIHNSKLNKSASPNAQVYLPDIMPKLERYF